MIKTKCLHWKIPFSLNECNKGNPFKMLDLQRKQTGWIRASLTSVKPAFVWSTVLFKMAKRYPLYASVLNIYSWCVILLSYKCLQTVGHDLLRCPHIQLVTGDVFGNERLMESLWCYCSYWFQGPFFYSIILPFHWIIIISLFYITNTWLFRIIETYCTFHI